MDLVRHALGRTLGPVATVDPFPVTVRTAQHPTVLDGFDQGEITIVATGSEVPLAVKAARMLGNARVVSAPSLELFDKQPAAYQDEVLGDRDKLVCIEAGRTDGWHKYAGREALLIGINRFGASAPYERLAEEFGFTPEKVAERVRAWQGNAG